jgi:histidine triad (HIT) family protein
MPEDCIFCNIVSKTIAANILVEDNDLMVIQDILPKAPVHVLVIPKSHIASVNELDEAHINVVGKMILTARDFARSHGIADSGYKLIFNVGPDGGQTVKHLHLHLLGGKPLGE